MSPVTFCHSSTGSLCRVFLSLCNVHLFSLFPLTKPQGKTLGKKRFSISIFVPVDLLIRKKGRSAHTGGKLKVHCHTIQRGRDSRPRRRPTRRRPLPHLFFFTCSELRDRLTLEYQSVTLAKSFPSPTKLGFEIWSRKWKQNDKFALNGEKFMESKTGLQSSTDRSWAVLVRQSFKTCGLSGAVVYISLHSTMYTPIIDRQDTYWARFVWKDARPPLFFPTTKWRKNHWIAWQCTFKYWSNEHENKKLEKSHQKIVLLFVQQRKWKKTCACSTKHQNLEHRIFFFSSKWLRNHVV